jgi:DNA-binding transcriptional LysR family regulator
MNLQQLETFLEIARLGSVSKAAEHLNATQSAVSMRLTDLERELGVALVDRRHRPYRLTAKGRDLAGHAEEVVALTRQIHRSIGDPARLSGSVRVGVAEHIALTWLPDMVAALNQRHPEAVVELEIGLLDEMMQQIRTGDIDVLLTASLDPPDPAFAYRPLGNVTFAWMASPGLGVPDAPLSPADLAQWPLITMTRSSVLHRLMENWFGVGGVRPKRINACNSLSVCAGLTRAGLGVGLLPRAYRAADGDDTGLVELSVVPAIAPTPFYAMHAAFSAPPLAGIAADLAVSASTFD